VQQVSDADKQRIAELLTKCDTFDQFMQVRYASVKRYGAEGAESLIPFVDQLFRSAAGSGIEDISIGMPHRGRLNMMTILLQYPSVAIFNKLLGKRELPPGSHGIGDVLSHLYQSVDLSVDGKNVHVSLLPNPSHLEAINPVVCGKTRSRQDHYEQKLDVELAFISKRRTIVNVLAGTRRPSRCACRFTETPRLLVRASFPKPSTWRTFRTSPSVARSIS